VTTPRSGIEVQLTEALRKREHLDTAISWIRSHIGIEGNEKADDAAALASILGEIAGPPPNRHRRRSQVNLEGGWSIIQTSRRIWETRDRLAQTCPLGLYVDEDGQRAAKDLAETHRQGDGRGLSMQTPPTKRGPHHFRMP